MLSKISSILILIILLVSCAAHNPNRVKIEDSSQRFHIIGLSILPPQSNGWNYEKKHPGSIEFGKPGEKQGQSFIALAVAHKLPSFTSEREFLLFVKNERWSLVEDKARYELLSNYEKLSYEKGELCVRIHLKYKDFKPANLPKSSSFLLVEDFGLVCIHPENRNIGISVALSQRSKPEDIIEDFEKMANSWFDSIEFESLPDYKNVGHKRDISVGNALFAALLPPLKTRDCPHSSPAAYLVPFSLPPNSVLKCPFPSLIVVFTTIKCANRPLTQLRYSGSAMTVLAEGLLTVWQCSNTDESRGS